MSSSTSQGNTDYGHVDALDGLRGLTILLVVFFHLRLLGFGWIGVQIFFVLSGFLITRILLKDALDLPLRSGLAQFYWRRSLRIFPALYVYLLILLALSYLVYELEPVREHLLYAGVYVYNFWGIFNGVFAVPPQSPEAVVSLNHLWSLSVEEHFYLFWPLIVYGLGARRLRVFVVVLIALGPVFRGIVFAWWQQSPYSDSLSAARAVYLFSTSHVDAFAAGALACFIEREGGRAAKTSLRFALGIVVAALLLGAMNWGGLGLTGYYPLTLGYPPVMSRGAQPMWGYTLINLASAYLILLAIGNARVGRLLSLPLLRTTGRLSYAIYFYHLPFAYLLIISSTALADVAGNRHFWFVVLLPAYFLVTYGAAWLSYRYVESPCLRMKDLYRPRAARQQIPFNASKEVK